MQVLASDSVNATEEAYILGRLNTAIQDAYTLSAADLTPASVAIFVSALNGLIDPANNVSSTILNTVSALVEALAAQATGDAASILLQVLANIVLQRGLVGPRTTNTRRQSTPVLPRDADVQMRIGWGERGRVAMHERTLRSPRRPTWMPWTAPFRACLRRWQAALSVTDRH